MAKTTARWLFAGSLIAVAVAYVNGSLAEYGPDVMRIGEIPFGWFMIVVAVLVMMVIAITQFIAWAGAVLNAARLNDRSWFIILLGTGLLSFGFIAMLIYLIVVA
jgi:dolichyl-phosphate-mannose--protein O-mannosyl transferase